MSDNPKLFEQYHNDMIETGRFFVSTDITLRDLFAAAVLAGDNLNEHDWGTVGVPKDPRPIISKSCYDMADAMLAERARR